MTDKMVLLGIYGNPIEAELVRAQLEAEGIRAYVLGTTSGDLFSGMGVGWSNVQLLVPEGDYQRATELLAEETDGEREDRDETDDPASTDIRAAVESPIQSRPSSAEAAAEDEESSELPSDEDMPAEDEEREQRSLTWTADDIATRAFRAALFSYVLWPILWGVWALWPLRISPGLPMILISVLFYLYAMYLILRLPFIEGELSPAGSRKATVAVILTLLPFLLGIWLMWVAPE